MSKTFFDIAISLDGYLAGTNASPDKPLGDDGLFLHHWMFVQKTLWKHPGTGKGTGIMVKSNDFYLPI